LRLDSLASHRGEHHFAHLIAVAQHDQRVASEVAYAKRFGPDDGSVGGRSDDQWLVEERGCSECGVAAVQRKNDEGEIEFALREHPHEISAALLDEDVDAGIGVAEAAERGRQQHGRQRRCGPQPQLPAGEA
jgi:hypothetical protein